MEACRYRSRLRSRGPGSTWELHGPKLQSYSTESTPSRRRLVFPKFHPLAAQGERREGAAAAQNPPGGFASFSLEWPGRPDTLSKRRPGSTVRCCRRSPLFHAKDAPTGDRCRQGGDLPSRNGTGTSRVHAGAGPQPGNAFPRWCVAKGPFRLKFGD